MKHYLLTALIALVCGFAGAGLWSVSGLGHSQTRAWLLDHPEILPDMAEAFRKRQAQAQLAEVKDDVLAPFPGAVLGNPQGSKVLVKFTDYGCTYCRASVAEVDRLIAADPALKVVIREWPIFDGSEQAARMALAAAKQGKYAAFYHAMFADAPPGPASVEQAARQAGLDLDAAKAFAASEAATAELAKNMSLARTLGFSGTPAWVANGEVIEGYVDYSRLAAAFGDD